MEKQFVFNRLLDDDIQQFIKNHEKDDEIALVLKQKEILGVPSAAIAQQINGKREAKTKLPQFYQTPKVLYPPKVNLEQCSSESAALFKSRLYSGKLAADLTGGFGVDSYYLRQSFEKVYYTEINESLLQIVKHNHRVLGAQNIDHCFVSAESFLKSHNEHFDLIYIDPSRRSQSNKKLYKFSDCQPNIVALLPDLLSKSNIVVIKASPLHDIQLGINELKCVSKVIVVSVANECKELLYILEKKSNAEVLIDSVDLGRDGIVKSSFSYYKREEAHAIVNYAEPQTYLFEPSASILKAGAFKLISNKFKISKLAPNTHLYTSDHLVSNFPGKIFHIEAYLKATEKSIKQYLPENKANITTRNYPMSTAVLKKKLKVKDGGEKFIIGFSGQKKKYLAVATRVK